MVKEGRKFQVGDVQHFEFREGDEINPWDAKHIHPPMRWTGIAKGMRQVLWERGLYEPGMVKEDMMKALEKCHDFATEMTLLEKDIFERGHLLIMSPKGHPEIAGVGVEYAWGKSKREFRQLNDLVPKHLHKNILKAFECLDVQRCCRFARKTREYKRAYARMHGLFGAGEEEKLEGFAEVEKFVKAAKTHRSADGLDAAFIARA